MFFIIPGIFYIFSINQLRAQEPWTKELPGMGTFSSPRVADLNGDGVGDVILGAGREEFLRCDSAVIALDGQTGEILWQVSAIDQVFGSANLKDITGDGIVDVFINGRSAELKAINGRTGEVIWQFDPPDKKAKNKNKSWFNFYNPQFIPDQDGDGLEDILTSNGGDVLADPYDPNRPVGYLVILSSQNGQLIAKAPMPDGKEIYMSVSALTKTNDHTRVIFGTGGETIGGHLYVTTLSDILKGDISQSILLDSSENKGFIAPPAWVDITQDGIEDIVVNAVDGRLLAFDGQSFQKLWQIATPNTEAYSSLAIGYFNEDKVPDFFVSLAEGVWPDLTRTQQFMINGLTGEIEFKEKLGYYQTSTPVVVDINQDGLDEAIMLVTYQAQKESFLKSFYTMPVVIDFKANKVYDFGGSFEGGNISSTPWIGDMDNDQNLDLVFCHGSNGRFINTFNGFKVERITTNIQITQKIKWGAYMGSNYDGVFKEE